MLIELVDSCIGVSGEISWVGHARPTVRLVGDFYSLTPFWKVAEAVWLGMSRASGMFRRKKEPDQTQTCSPHSRLPARPPRKRL